MTGARQLATNALDQRAVLGTCHAQNEHPPRPGRPTRSDVEAQPAGGYNLKRIVDDVERGPAQAVKPADGAAFAGEKVVGDGCFIGDLGVPGQPGLIGVMCICGDWACPVRARGGCCAK